MEKILRHLFAILLILFSVSCYRTSDSLDGAERDARARAERKFLQFMSVKTMFPDPDVRELARAAGRGSIPGIERSLSDGVDVNATGAREATPLYWAMRNFRGFEHLLQLGADPNIVYGDGTTIIERVVDKRDVRLLEAMAAYGADLNLRGGSRFGAPPISFAVPNEDKHLVEKLLELGADIDAQNNNGVTAIMISASSKNFRMVQYLLDLGADPAIKTKNGHDLAFFVKHHYNAGWENYYDSSAASKKFFSEMESVIDRLEAAGFQIRNSRERNE